ncbi:arsenic resistance N-acetyltransferase ArsN2 [Halostella salina]|uniref:arsenic resistance N-acetyltransferase ArsN2 n=1 Tax=Halostella salina TaxID=1547897 RepID=UPI000EF784A6|nr:arsenic resistance N-acetyltransferase ArsN2 [Halostella salina]
MSDALLTLRPADDALDYVETLLAANDLPTADVREKPDCFYVASDGDERVGVGGVERDGDAGLLRSVVVDRSARGEGYGAALCEALEAEASADGVGTLYLLTTTAAAFFAARGYEVVERDAAPTALRGTAEFDDLCPAAATCMRKSL